MDFLRNLFRGIFVMLLTLAGLGITFTLLAIGVVSLGVMYVVYLIRGKNFSAAQHWQQSRTKAQQTQSRFTGRFRQPAYSRRPPQEVSDLDVRELK